jgi:hypothetical protein
MAGSAISAVFQSAAKITTMAKFKRRQLFVDSRVQGALVLRLLGYWVVTMITVSAMVLCWRMVSTPARPFASHVQSLWLHYGSAFVAAILLLPLIVIDCVRTSNRFAGPLYRLRRSMRDLTAGLPVPPIHFREGDFWSEVADDFNAVSARLQRLEEELAAARGETSFDESRYPVATVVD